ncbi:MAG: gliding motility-associated C-terminal domain-containing protein, partial [Cyclobacteriaceae bacterium]|nr:gliding motility-associated C-terminal domain-containing protein [Cyclobacteriaceae bacterium]
FLYGMALVGGTANDGTIFKIRTDGTGFAKLLDFNSNVNGERPFGSFMYDGTSLYGLTLFGIGSAEGTLFKINTDGSAYSMLCNFANYLAGSRPYASLVSEGGFLFGMTNQGGTNDTGVIFRYAIGVSAPTITSFTPTSGAVGTTVTITGTNFSTTPASNTVQFNGTTAVVTASTTTSITTTVPAGATTGTITVTVVGNTATSATNFTVTASPVITITTQPSDFIACLGQNATFTTAASGATNIIYQWQFSPDGIAPFTDIANGAGYTNANTATLSVNTTANFGLGRYRCRINGDFASEVITTNQGLSINPISTAPTVAGANRCGVGSVTLTASGGTNGQYKWYTTPIGGTAIAGETNSSYVTPSITAPTSYFVSLNTNGCESTRTLVTATLTITPAPTATGASGCPASAVTLTASGGTSGQYNWYTVATGGGAITGATNNTYEIASLTNTSTFYVSLTISGCESTRTAVTATLLSTGCAPVITTQTLATQVEGKIEINLQSFITTPGTLDPTSIKVITQPASGAVASITNFLLVIDYKGKPFSGKETIIIEACNTNGLCAQQTFTIEVAGDVIVFNAVSPNGDGKNEFLVLQFIESISPKNQVSIYNRWGDEVFSIADYDNKTRVFVGLGSGGSKLPSGTYFYKVNLIGAGKTLTGFILLKN